MKKIIFEAVLILLSKETKSRNFYFMHDWIKFGCHSETSPISEMDSRHKKNVKLYSKYLFSLSLPPYGK
jgi:hypothetical protein